MPDRGDKQRVRVRKSLVTRPSLLGSHKMDGLIPCASPLEAQAAMLFEVDPDVTAYWAQPGAFTFELDGERRFIPDFEVMRRGERGYFEIKPIRWVRRPSTNQELRAKKAAMVARGLSYRVLTELDLLREPRSSNVQHLWHAHRFGRTIAEEIEARRILTGRCGMAVRDLAQAMRGDATRVFGLICAGVLTFDDALPLGLDTVVRLRCE